MADLCDDGRFELIEKFKFMLMESTNISDSEDELKVLDTILFRFWQMGWLDKLEQANAQPEVTLESAIDYLHSIGWMQKHDKEITDSAYTEGYTAAESKYRALWDEMQATQPERKTGKWIADKYGNVLCSECNWCAPKIMMGCNSNRHLAYTKSDYCWHCGARMVQEGEDNE